MGVPHPFVSKPNIGGGPYLGAAAVTPHDTNELAYRPTSALHIGGAGDGALVVVMADGSTGTFAGLTANTILPISVVKVKSTGTGVTSIVALY